MFRVFVCLAIFWSGLWVRPTPADACGIKMSIKSRKMQRTLVAQRTSPTPQRTLVARRPIRTGPASRAPIATGIRRSSAAGATASTVDENSAAPTQVEADRPAADESASSGDTRVATATTETSAAAAETVPPPQQPERTRASTPARGLHGRVFFGLASAALSDHAKQRLARNASWWKRHGSTHTLMVEGHSSTGGPAKLNQELSERRAQAVKDQLIELGVDEANIEISAFGMTRPAYRPGTNPKNRRVVIRARK